MEDNAQALSARGNGNIAQMPKAVAADLEQLTRDFRTFVADCETNPTCQEDPQQTDLLLVTSPDRGGHWTAPVKIDGLSGSHFFPWAAAGSCDRPCCSTSSG